MCVNKASTKRGNKRQPTDASEEDFEAFDHLNNKSSNLNLSLVSEQHNYATRSASLQHLNPDFCPTILGCYYWNDIPLSIRNKPTRKLFKKALYQFYFAQY